LESLKGLDSWQVVFVNDGSQDGSLETILTLRAQDPRFKVITLSRNFGYHSVLVAGLTLVDSDLYSIIDVDCEDPPELLAAFFQTIQGGADVAYGIRSQRKEPRLITWFRWLFYYINNHIADSPTVLWMAEFTMMTLQVRNAIIAPRTTYPFLRAEIAYAGFKRVGVPYVRSERIHGKSHYNLYGMTKFAIVAFLSSSTFPLRMITYTAILVGALLPLSVWWLELSAEQGVQLAVFLLFYFILFAVPSIALYLARTYKNGVARPVYLVDQNQTHLT